ncbi:MAG: hypothetical protein ACTHU0_27865 [Kofleriaceae bacterium]
MGSSLALLRELWGHLASRGWHCCLTGGVLVKGQSDHDLDVVVFPAKAQYHDLDKLYEGLELAGLRRCLTTAQVRESWETRHDVVDRKHVEVWRHGTKRVDIIVWPEPVQRVQGGLL